MAVVQRSKPYFLDLGAPVSLDALVSRLQTLLGNADAMFSQLYGDLNDVQTDLTSTEAKVAASGIGVSVVQGDLLVGTGPNTLAALHKSATATRYLANTGGSNQPQWDQVNLANGVSGVLPLASYASPITVEAASNATGTQNDWAPTIAVNGTTIQPWNGTADIIVTGLSGLPTGAIWIFKNIGTKNAFFPHLNAGSAAAHQFTNIITVGNGTPVAPGGFIAYYNDGTNLKILGHEQGASINVTFNAGDFTANGAMTWTVSAGNVATFAYRVRGAMVLVSLFISNTTVGGTLNNELLVKIPNGFNIAVSKLVPIQVLDNGVAGSNTGLLSANTSVAVNQLLVFKDFGGSNYSASTAATFVRGDIEFSAT